MDAPFRSLASLFEKGAFAKQRAKLLGPVVTTDQTGEPAQPDAVASGQNDAPAMRQACCFRSVRRSVFAKLFSCRTPGEVSCFHQTQSV